MTAAVLTGVAAAVVLAAAAGWLRARAEPKALIEAKAEPYPTIPEIPDLEALDPAVAKAIEEAESRVHERPDDPAANGELGRLYHAHKHIELARQSYESARRLDPRAPDWPYYLGLFAAERGDLDEARELFERVVELRPDYAPAWYRLGEALLGLGRLDDAERAFARVVDLEPGAPWGYLGLGRTARRRADWHQAVARLERALELDSGQREAIYLLAMSRRELGQEQEATRLLARFAQAAPGSMPDPILDLALGRRTDLESFNQSANRLLAAGNVEAAEALYLTLLGTDPRHFDALYNLGLLYSRTGRYQEAAAALEQAVSVRPASADARFLLALTELSLERADRAMPHLQRALELDPEHELARDLWRRLSGPP